MFRPLFSCLTGLEGVGRILIFSQKTSNINKVTIKKLSYTYIKSFLLCDEQI